MTYLLLYTNVFIDNNNEYNRQGASKGGSGLLAKDRTRFEALPCGIQC